MRHSDVLAATDGDSVRFCGKINTRLNDSDKFRVSFTGGNNTHIYVGEYYSNPSYETPDSHKFECNKEKFGGLILEYRYDDSAPFGVYPEPTAALSVIDRVQGLCFDNLGDLYVSVSASTAFSSIVKYNREKLYRMDDITIYENNVVHYAMVTTAKEYAVKTPPMSEEIIIIDNRLYAVNEFAANKFLLGKIIGAGYCYSFELPSAQ